MNIKNKIKFPKIISKKKIENFFINLGLKNLVVLSKNRSQDVNELVTKNIYKPELLDLYRLFQFVRLNKRTTILEFGSGWSSLVMSIAMMENKKRYNKIIFKLRRNNPFEIFSVDNEKKYLSITKKRITNFFSDKKKKSFFNKNIHISYSECYMTDFNGHYATAYKKLPLCNPDFIYLDGPDQFNVKGSINNFTTAHLDMMPMVSDILKMEFYLTPGTIILSDGRGANVDFLLKNFKRKWLHLYEKNFDQHLFYLDAESIGPYNDRQLNFYKN
jgi:hypothetical protein